MTGKRSKQMNSEEVCPLVGKQPGDCDHSANLFCHECPDAILIPASCKMECGWPEMIMPLLCKHHQYCPCARPCSGERAEALCLHIQEEKEKKKRGLVYSISWILKKKNPREEPLRQW